jgi:CCR4-NOT transcription complex subunit 3
MADMNPEPTAIAPPPKTPAKEEKKPVTPKATKEAVEEQPPSPIAAKKHPSRKSTMEIKVASAPEKSSPAPPVPPIVKSEPAKAPLPAIRYAAAAAAAVASASAPTSQPEAPTAKEDDPQPIIEAVSLCRASVLTNQAPAPAPGLSSVPPQPQSVVTSPSEKVPSLAHGSQSPVAGPAGYTPHAESSRAGSAASTSPRPVHGVLGNLMQSFDVAKELCKWGGLRLG